jgi:hypothetical protein
VKAFTEVLPYVGKDEERSKGVIDENVSATAPSGAEEKSES